MLIFNCKTMIVYSLVTSEDRKYFCCMQQARRDKGGNLEFTITSDICLTFEDMNSVSILTQEL